MSCSLYFFLSSGLLLTLTPRQRWEALRRTFETGLITEPWFIPSALVLLFVLLVFFFLVSYNRSQEHRRLTNQLFLDMAERRGLSPHECLILLGVANAAGLKQKSEVFTIEKAFDRGAAKLVQITLAGKSADECKQLQSELSFLREKLGFQKQPGGPVGTSAQSRKLSSRQIPVGRKLLMTRRKNRQSGDIEAAVVLNSDIELTVETQIPLKAMPYEYWRIRYYFGASVWEFDTMVARCEGTIIVLNHSDNVRYINRRRFLRVPVEKLAFVAPFPFITPLSSNNDWQPPAFVEATITELAGPGLRIKVPIEFNIGDRVLVLLRLDPEKPAVPDTESYHAKEDNTKMVQDIGQVRHVRSAGDVFSIAVELIGLSDSDVAELVRATNAAADPASRRNQ